MKKSIIIISITLSSYLATLHAEPIEPTAIVSAASDWDINKLPVPCDTPRIPKTLTLQDAILLALRNNPDVFSSQLQRVVDKYALEVAYYNYEPQFAINGNATIARGEKPTGTIGPVTTLNSTFGTQTSLNVNFNKPGGDTENLTVLQPLLRGFGAVNLVPLLDAKDTETINKLSFKNNTINTVVTIITDYYTLVEDYNSLQTQMLTLKTQEQLVAQYKLQVKIGKLARSELLQQESTLATTRLQTNEQKNQLQQAYQQLLGDIGLNPALKLNVDYKINIEEYKLPTDQEAITIALADNIEYQTALLALKITKRQILVAHDANRPQLDMTGTVDLTHTNIDDGSPSLQFDLNVPIDDVALKQQLISAQVAYRQAQLSLESQRIALVRSVINSLTQLRYQHETILLDINAVKLLSMSLRAEEIKLKYGKSTMFNVTQLQNQVLSQQIDLINQQITYLLNITSFEQLLGETLERWNIKLLYYGKDDNEHHNYFRY